VGRRVELIAEVTGVVWQVEQAAGARVAAGDAVVVIESMKMEIPVEAPCAGTVVEVRCAESDPVREGDVIAILDAD
jgi:acetyl-CoA carboxylase biotin carboxyl carrier protein